MVTFRLHRKGVVFIVIGAILVALLIFVAGCVFGMRRRPPDAARPVPTATAATVAPPAPAPSELLAVRVAVLDSEDEAKALVQQLTARKLDASIVPVTTAAGVTLYTVQVGQYPTRATAAAAAAALAEEHGLQPAVVPAGAGRLK